MSTMSSTHLINPTTPAPPAITTLFLLPLALINILLIIQVLKARALTDTYLGHESNKPLTKPPSSSPSELRSPTAHDDESSGSSTGIGRDSSASDTTTRPTAKDKRTYGMNMRFATISSYDPLYVATRSHANFHENVPFALICAMGIELCGGGGHAEAGGGGKGKPWGLIAVLTMFVVARVAHYQGMKENWTYWRMVGAFGTWFVLGVLGVWAGWVGFGAL